MEDFNLQVKEKNSISRSQINILLVEDNETLGEFLKDYLEIKGYRCVWVKDGEAGLDEFFRGKCNFCLLDVMLPKKDGFALAKDIRYQNKRVPILFLTAKDSEQDRIKGFELGCDDYITKPFSMEELILRIQTIVKRLDETTDLVCDRVVLGRIGFDFSRHIAIIPPKGREKLPKELSLSRKENEILRLFCQYRNEIVYRKLLLEQIWHDHSVYASRSLDVYMTRIRKILAHDPNIEIGNIHGIGYKINTHPKIIKEIEAYIGKK
ncbi:DNA-binding response regulator [Bacteroidia bacterium]|nr:DNA-binding response regulator [Bacteroidia bacterium]